MKRSISRSPIAALLFTSLALTGCGGPVDTPDDAALIIRGSAGSPSEGPSQEAQGVPPGSPTGSPSSLTVDLYSLYVSATPDCADLIQVEDHGSTPVSVDLVAGPVLFSGNPPSGEYACVIFRVSDLVRARTATSFGGCVAGSEYTADVYREGQSDYRDVDGKPVIGRGSDSAPVSDMLALVLSRDPAAAMEQGYDAHQILQIGSSLVVPGVSTFYWNGAQTIVSENDGCRVYPGHPEFQ